MAGSVSSAVSHCRAGLREHSSPSSISSIALTAITHPYLHSQIMESGNGGREKNIAEEEKVEMQKWREREVISL